MRRVEPGHLRSRVAAATAPRRDGNGTQDSHADTTATDEGAKVNAEAGGCLKGSCWGRRVGDAREDVVEVGLASDVWGYVAS